MRMLWNYSVHSYCTTIMLPGRTGIRYTLGMGMSRHDKYLRQGSVFKQFTTVWQGSVFKELTISLIVQLVKNLQQCRRPGLNSWVRKIPWRRKWQPTPTFLPGESHGQRSLAGYSPWVARVGHNLVTKSPPPPPQPAELEWFKDQS